MRAHACYTCEHVLPTRASTLLVVRARLLFKNVLPGHLGGKDDDKQGRQIVEYD